MNTLHNSILIMCNSTLITQVISKVLVNRDLKPITTEYNIRIMINPNQDLIELICKEIQPIIDLGLFKCDDITIQQDLIFNSDDDKPYQITFGDATFNVVCQSVRFTATHSFDNEEDLYGSIDYDDNSDFQVVIDDNITLSNISFDGGSELSISDCESGDFICGL